MVDGRMKYTVRYWVVGFPNRVRPMQMRYETTDIEFALDFIRVRRASGHAAFIEEARPA